MQKIKEDNIGSSLIKEKVYAYLKIAQESKKFWTGVIIFISSMLGFMVFPFYPTSLMLIISLICGYIGIKKPPIGVIISSIFLLFAITYQTPVLGAFYAVFLSLIL